MPVNSCQNNENTNIILDNERIDSKENKVKISKNRRKRNIYRRTN